MNNVTHDPIFQVATGFMAAKHLFAATEIGLFEKLASGPATVDELAQRTGSPRRTLRMVADAMVALGFLERVEGQYRNSPEADLFLSGRDPTSDLRPAMRFFNLFSYRRWEKFEEAVRFDKPVFGKYEIAEGEKEYYYAGMEKITTMAAQALVAAYDFIPHRSLLDLGGGTGSFVEVILRRYTGLGATVYDRPHITSVTRRRLAPFGDRVQVVEGNFFIDPIPTGHDAVLLANIVHIRIIAATNRNLDASVKEGRFREDLYHRLNVVPIILPPLRERKEDIIVLAQHFLQRFSFETKKNFTEIAREAEEKLQTYEWPGNVRELANVIERAVVLGQGPKMTLQDLPPRVVATGPGRAADNLSYREAINASKRELILGALAQSKGNRAAASKALGLHEKYLLRLIKSLRIG